MIFSKIASLFGFGKIVTVIDIGSSKVSCLIARLVETLPQQGSAVLYGRRFRSEILGFGLCNYKPPFIFDRLDLAPAKALFLEAAIRHAVAEAEKCAGVIADNVIATCPSFFTQSQLITSNIALANGVVEQSAADRLYDKARALASLEERDYHLLHMTRLGFYLDNKAFIDVPFGKNGQELSASYFLVKAPFPAVQYLEYILNKAHLSLNSFVAPAYASALAILTQEEAASSSLWLDIGAFSVELGLFACNSLRYIAHLPQGGHRLSQALAHVFRLSLSEAEYVKLHYGSLFEHSLTDQRPIAINCASELALPSLTYGQLNQVIAQYNHDILAWLRRHLESFEGSFMMPRSLILTGAGAQLPGMVEFYKDNLELEVRMGRPLGLRSLPDDAKKPAFASLAGLLVHAQMIYDQGSSEQLKAPCSASYGGDVSNYDASGSSLYANLANPSLANHWQLMGQWLRENF